MRLLFASTIFSVMVAPVALQAQIFPTLDKNASPPVTPSVNKVPEKPVAKPAPAAAAPVTVGSLPDAGPAVTAKSGTAVPVTPAAFPSANSAVSPQPAKTVQSPGTMPAVTSSTITTPAITPIKAVALDDSLKAAAAMDETYILGAQDTLAIRVANMEELGEDPYPIDLSGNVTLPRVGRVHAAGKTVEDIQVVLTQKFKEYLQDPSVTVAIAEYHSQPVSIMGAVENPGVHQIRGNKTLFEVISEAGGLKDDAGNRITVTRKLVNGAIPLPNAFTDPSGRFSIAELNIRSVMSAKSPQDNIPVKPYDVITVPKADLVYVIGAVKRPGGFPLQERANMTVLEALSLAQGLDRGASSRKGRILRTDEVTHARVEIPIDVKEILEGKGNDQPLLSNDILFVPSSAAKLASYRALEALIQTGTGVAIYRP